MSTYTEAQRIFLKALKSGEYTQLKDKRRYADGDEEKCSFCLIGVAMNELALVEGKDFSEVGHDDVMRWLGGSLNCITLSNGHSVTECNDSTSMTFKQIAKQLKEYWLRKRLGT